MTVDDHRATCGARSGAIDRPAPGEAAYSCPMHPAEASAGPAACRVCGMAMASRHPAAVARDPEYTSMSRRFRLAAALGVPLLVIAMIEPLPSAPLAAWAPRDLWLWLQFTLATPIVLWGGWPFFQRAWRSFVNRVLTMFSLIGIGTGVAYLYSVVALAAPDLFPAAFRGADGRVPVYFEAAGVITALVLLGQVLELGARNRTGAAIRALLALAPATARVVVGAGTEDRPLEAVRVGDRLLVRPGETVPVDGVVLTGVSAVDEAMMTGEPIAAGKAPGDAVTGGTLNGAGAFTMRAERVGAETLLHRIVRLVSEAQRSAAPIQRLADIVSGRFVPAVVGIAIAAALAWVFLGLIYIARRSDFPLRGGKSALNQHDPRGQVLIAPRLGADEGVRSHAAAGVRVLIASPRGSPLRLAMYISPIFYARYHNSSPILYPWSCTQSRKSRAHPSAFESCRRRPAF